MDLLYDNRVLSRCFERAIAKVNIRTGEGFCRIQELWDTEGVTISENYIPVALKEEVQNQNPSPPPLEIPDYLPQLLKAKLQVIVLSNQGLSTHDIAKMTGESAVRVANTLHWKDQFILQSRAIREFMAGNTFGHIAQRLHISQDWVKKLVKKYKLERVVLSNASGL